MNTKEIKALSPKKSEGGDTADTIRELAVLLEETGLTEIEVEQNGVRLRVSRAVQTVVGHAGAAPAAAAPAPAAETPKGPPAGAVPSPMVGTVYVAPEPGKPPFVKVGDTVKEGDTLLIVEAMKTMNPILAPRSGSIKEICVSDAQPVEFGQTLLIIG
jgi:acetyl-CoA carboxylase biotin carboxyl carrier protein